MSAPRRRPWERALLRIGGLEVRAHISVLLPFLVWDHGRFSAGGALGVLLVLLTHAAGHLLAAAAVRGPLSALTFHGAGAWVRRVGDWPRRAAMACAWGGVLAQAALLIVAGLGRPWIAALAPPPWLVDLHEAALFGNLALLLYNLLPFGMNDGAVGLRLLRPAQPAPGAGQAPAPIPAEVARRAEDLMLDLRREARHRRASGALPPPPDADGS